MLVMQLWLQGDCRQQLRLGSQAHNFGDPFLFRVSDSETLAELRPRLQSKLGVPDEEFAKWKFAVFCNLRPPDYLQDDDVVASKFVKSNTSYNSPPDSMYLGLEHIDTLPHRHRHHTNRCALLGMCTLKFTLLNVCFQKVSLLIVALAGI